MSDQEVFAPRTVTCSGCDKDYQFDTERHAIEFISEHKRYIGHEPELEGGSE